MFPRGGTRVFHVLSESHIRLDLRKPLQQKPMRSWIVGVASFFGFLELSLHRHGIATHQVVTMNPVCTAFLLARHQVFVVFKMSASINCSQNDRRTDSTGQDHHDQGRQMHTCLTTMLPTLLGVFALFSHYAPCLFSAAI